MKKNLKKYYKKLINHYLLSQSKSRERRFRIYASIKLPVVIGFISFVLSMFLMLLKPESES